MTENRKRRITTGMMQTINLGDFENVKLEASISTVIKDSEDVNEEFDKLWEICEDQIEAQAKEYDEDDSDTKGEQPIDSELETPTDDVEITPDSSDHSGDEVDEDDGPSEEEIEKMSKPNLIKLIKKEQLKDIDTTVGVKILRAVVIDELFEDDDASTDDTPTDEEDEGPSEEEINKMSKDDLIELIEKEKLEGIDTSVGVGVLRAVVIDELFEDDATDADDATDTNDDSTDDGTDDSTDDGDEWNDNDWNDE